MFICQNIVHGKCSKQQNVQSMQARVTQYYTCGNCLFNELPFKNSNLQKLDKSIKLDDQQNANTKLLQPQKSFHSAPKYTSNVSTYLLF